MKKVTKDKFFAAIGPKNVMPRVIPPNYHVSVWETPARTVVGRSEYSDTYPKTATYYLA